MLEMQVQILPGHLFFDNLVSIATFGRSICRLDVELVYSGVV